MAECCPGSCLCCFQGQHGEAAAQEAGKAITLDLPGTPSGHCCKLNERLHERWQLLGWAGLPLQQGQPSSIPHQADSGTGTCCRSALVCVLAACISDWCVTPSEGIPALLQALQHFTNSTLAAAFVSWRDNVVELQVEAAQLQTACQRWQQSALAMAFASWVDWHLEQRDR